MIPYQLLFTDLDGTLLDSRSKLSEANRKAIAKALSAGKHIVICSGRSWKSLGHFEHALDLDRPGRYGIAFNGSVVYENTRDKLFLFQQPMEARLGQEVVAALKSVGADMILYTGDRLLIERETPDIQSYTHKVKLTPTFVSHFEEVTEDIIKIVIKGPHRRLAEIKKSITPLFAGRCSVFFSSDDLLECSHPEAHKGRAVTFLAEYLGIPKEAVIAVGDHANDISMLQTAGLGIAVANAVPETKAAADLTLRESNDRDAVSRVIHEYLLKD